MNLIDRWITELFPAWGAARLASRYRARSYDAALADRLNARRPTVLRQRGAVAEIREDRAKLVQVARDLDRNNGYARGVFNAIVYNVVSTGITLEPRLERGDGSPDTEANKEIKRRFAAWSRAVDPERRRSLAQLQRMVVREEEVAGECLIVRSVVKAEPGRVPLALEVIPAERLSTEERQLPSGNRIVQGIEFDGGGRRVAYWIYPTEIDDPFGAVRLEPERVEAERVIHFYDPSRTGHIRGIPRNASVVRFFTALSRYLDLTLTKAQIQSSVAILLMRGKRAFEEISFSQTGDSEEGSPDAVDELVRRFEGGLVFEGRQGDDLKGFAPSVTGSDFLDFVVFCLRSIAVGLGVSYELLAKDFTKSNFSNTRQAKLEDRRAWEVRQDLLIETVLEPIWGWFAELSAPLDRRLAADMPHAWRPPRWPWVDPLDDVEGAQMECANLFRSPQRVAAERGVDFDEVLEETAEALARAKELGLQPAWAGVPAGTEDGGSEGGDDGEKAKEEGGRDLSRFRSRDRARARRALAR